MEIISYPDHKRSIMLDNIDDKFEKIFRHSPVAMALADAVEYKTIDVNTAFEQLYGYSKYEILGKTSRDIQLYTDMKQREQIITFLRSNIPLKNYEVNVQRKTGEKRTILLSMEFLEIEGKNCILSVSQDITYRKQAEEALQASEDRFRIMADSSPYMIWVNDSEGKVQFVNKTYLEFFGVSTEQLLQENWLPLIHPGDKDWYIDEYFVAVKERSTFKAECRVKHATGEWRWIHSQGEPRFTTDGEYIGHIGSSNDITENKILEESLRRNEQKYRGLFTSLQEGFLLTELVYSDEGEVVDFRYIEINPATEKITGIKLEDVIGKTARQVIPDLNEELIKLYAQVASTGESFRHEIYEPFLNQYHENFIFSPEKDKVAVLFSDITERKISQQRLEQTLSELRRSNEDLEQFAHIASHDLQEPTRMMMSYAQLFNLKYGKELDETARLYLKFMTEGASRMHMLINDLLKYSSLTARQGELNNVDCNLILRDVLTDFSLSLKEGDVQISAERLPVIKGNITEIRQMFQNFIQNSIKFRSERQPEIKIACEKQNSHWLFSISDNGIGIEKELHHKIFVIFQRLHDHDKYPGTGIGLALCKKIIERHGGNVWLDSEPGKGTTFFFTLPC